MLATFKHAGGEKRVPGMVLARNWIEGTKIPWFILDVLCLHTARQYYHKIPHLCNNVQMCNVFSSICCGLTLWRTRGYPILSGTVAVNLPVLPSFSGTNYEYSCRHGTCRDQAPWPWHETVYILNLVRRSIFFRHCFFYYKNTKDIVPGTAVLLKY